MLCDDLEGWDREDGREAQEGGYMGTYVCIWLILFVMQLEVALLVSYLFVVFKNCFIVRQ